MGRFDKLLGEFSNNDIIDYCDKCELCIRNSMTPSRGNGVEARNTIMHLVTAPSPADNKSKIILSGNSGKFVRRVLNDKGLLKLSYFTSIVKCGIYQQVDAIAIKNCFPRLKSEIERINPTMFITYGRNPYYIIKGQDMITNEGIELLPNNKILIHTVSLEYMKVNNDYSYLDRAYNIAIEAYKKFINKWINF